MIQAWKGDGTLVDADEVGALSLALWVDLCEPGREEEARVEAAFGIDVPTSQDMRKIEDSSRAYKEGSAWFLTATLLAGAGTATASASPVTFILTDRALVTVRHSSPRAFELFAARLGQPGQNFATVEELFMALLETVVTRIAAVLETIDRSVADLSKRIFQPGAQPVKDLRELIRQIGQQGDLNSAVRESLVSLQRLAAYLVTAVGTPTVRPRGEVLERDLHSLTEHVSFVGGKVNFLLDATLGLINVRQNATIRVLSVVAVIFLPPTLIASIYGMNFAHIPELDWRWGYPTALLAMTLSAVVPWWWIKRLL